VAIADLIGQAAQQYGIPPSLLSALIQSESGGDPYATNAAGYAGLGQISPANVRALGINPYDPAENINASASILSGFYRKYGNWEDALTNYKGSIDSPVARSQALQVLANAGGGDPRFAAGAGMPLMDPESGQPLNATLPDLGSILRGIGGNVGVTLADYCATALFAILALGLGAAALWKLVR